jgi:GTP-binding protein
MKTRSFIDQVTVHVKAGKGGDGSASFRREALVAFGGPDGGDGGRGGDVVLRASVHVNSLISIYFQPRLFAENGVDGSGRQCYGRRGRDLVVDVPPGTIVTEAETGIVIADLSEVGQKVVVAKGGNGGFGNVHFKSSVNQAPTERTLGGEGEEKRLKLELKTIADAGLVGFPNAGKSSLLSRISAAAPKIASYPFTTMNPIVGIVNYADFSKISVADVPGIIEGAARGVGLGLDFLRHLERARVLIYIIDMAGTDGRKPWEDYLVLKREVMAYSEDLASRPYLVVANKMDVPEAKDNLNIFIKETQEKPIAVSCAGGDDAGLDEFKNNLREIVMPVTDENPEKTVRRDISQMPETDGAEIPPEALDFATFLSLEKPKKRRK